MFFGLFRKKRNSGRGSNIQESNESITESLEIISKDLSKKNLEINKDYVQLTKHLDNMPVSYVVIDYDRNILKVNKKLKSLIGCYTDNTCVGNKLTDYIHPDDIRIFSGFIRSVKSIRDNNSSIESIFRTLSKDGRVNYIKWRGMNIVEDQKILLFGHDISSELEITSKIRDIISHKNLVFNNYPGSIISMDMKGIIIEVNKQALITSNYNMNEICGKHIFEIFPDKNLFDPEKMGDINPIHIKTKEGELIPCFLLVLPLKNEDGDMVGYFGVWHGLDYVEYLKKNFLS